VAPFVWDKPPAGDHEYEFAPVAVIVVLCPSQILALFTPTIGRLLTTIVTIPVSEQVPLLAVTV
jgi:hypothetical protein